MIDLTGKSVIPGLVMVHEHLYYPTGPGVYGQLGESFIRLYLAGGVTTMRTGGNVNGFMDLKLKQLIEAATAGRPRHRRDRAVSERSRTRFLQMRDMKDADEARKHVAYWADMGATSFKAYMQITPRAARRGGRRGAQARAEGDRPPLLGHLRGSGRSRHRQSRARLPRRRPTSSPTSSRTRAPARAAGQRTIAALDENGEPFKALVKKLVDKKVALTSTLTVFETFTPGRPMPPGLDVLLPQLKQQFEQNHQRTSQSQTSVYTTLFPKALALERAFARAGGMLIAGTDPTGGGGVVPGYSNQRQLELLVEAGFTPLEAIRIGTLNGATYLGRHARVGSIAVGKQADLVVIDGDPSKTIGDVRKVETVFKQGVGFDPAKLIAAVIWKGGLVVRRAHGSTTKITKVTKITRSKPNWSS